MRLEELHLTAYGPFTDCTVELQPGLNVLYGPNEAGKSSSLRAVRALLFGVEARTRDNFVHSYPQLRVGGVLVDSQGRRLECVRRKGRNHTLRDGDDDQPVDEGEMRAMLGGLSEEFFTSVFGIDHQRLREGGEDVIRGEGRVGELLFSAGGVAHLREKQEAIQSAAAELFKPTGRKPRINAALSEARALSVQVRELQQSPEKWARHDTELRRLKEKETQLRQQLGEAESNKSRLERIRDAKEFVGAWKERQAQLAELADFVVLPDDAEQRFRDANEKRTLAAAAKVKAERRIDELQAALEMIDVPSALLSEETRIDELYRRLGSHEKAAEDRGVLAGQQRTARSAAKRTIDKLGWELSADDADERRVADEKKTRVRTLSSRYGEVTQGKSRQQQTLDRAESKLAKLKEELTFAKKPDEPLSLRNAISSVPTSLEVENGLCECREKVESLKREAEGALKRLPRWNGTLEEIFRLKVPGEETVDEFDKSGRDLANAIGTLAEQAEANLSERDDVAQKLEALELQESVPTEDELGGLRETRDRGVRLAVEKLCGEQLSVQAVNAFVSEVGEGEDLATALEPSVRQADEVSDRLRREASRVADKSQLVARLRSLEAKAERLQTKQKDAQTQQDDWNADWKSRWVASGIEPLSPSEMRGWLRKLADLLTLANELAKATDQLKKDERRVNDAIDNLRSELGQHGVDAPADATLGQLVLLADSQAEKIAAERRRYEDLELGVTRADEKVAEAKQDFEAAEGELRQWREDWAEAVRPLKLDADALPEQVEAVLTNLDELFRNLDDAEGFRSRIWGIDKTATEFADAAKEMAKQVTPELVELGVEELVTKLNQRLDEAKQIRQKADSLTEQLETERDIAEEAEQELTDSTAVLEAMVVEAACDGIDNLRTAIEASRKMRTLESDVAERERELTPLCGGKPLSKFLVEVEGEDADRLPTLVQDLADKVAGLRKELEETIAARQRETSELEKYGGSAEAADKAEERLSVLARMEDDVREYVIAMVAGRLLQRAIERYQEKSQGPVLEGASEYFRQLTCGSFEALRTDYDDAGREVLVGVRPGGGALLVEWMSEGTRDQLYLALRLGTLDHWFETHEPVPFIVDDVLLTFDDSRATAALQSLAAVAKHTQVLMFTHHEHIVSMVREECSERPVAISEIQA